ncbi:MAG: VOC family protein [Armatimonadota bacterium]|nr:VOC family protein [Armatimonadota bacterium]
MPDRLPVTHLDHISLRVPDPDAAAAYYARVMGLGETGRDAATGTIHLTSLPSGQAAVPPREIVLSRGDVSLDHFGLGVPDDAALARAAEMLRRRGVDVEGPRGFEGFQGPSVRLRDCDGHVVELVVTPRRVPRPAVSTPFDLVKLSHVNLRSADPKRAARWWQDVMDFRLSDEIPETFYWLRCNPEHTVVAFVRGGAAGLHHLGYEIASWDEILRLGDHFTANGAQIEFGPGRHGPGHTIFVYFVDPWGLRWEALCDIARIEDDATYVPGVWDPARGRLGAVNLWGPKPPQSFM